MKFQKGQSGNPGGLTAEQIRIRTKVQKAMFDQGDAAARRYAREIKNGKKNGFAASKDVIDRILGKPTDNLEVSGGISISVTVSEKTK